jgi:hypothetical protein
MNIVKEWKNLYGSFQNDIFAFCKLLNFKPSEEQREVLECIQKETLLPEDDPYILNRIAIKSGQGAGKTALSCLAAAWLTLRSKNAITYVTSPAMHHGRQVWLAEFRRIMRKAHPLIRYFTEVTKSDVRFGKTNPDWAIKLLTAKSPEAFAGRHAGRQYFILEEATGIEQDIWETVLGTQSSGRPLTIAISNPTKREGVFGDAFGKDAPLWHTFTFNAENCPFVNKSHLERLEKQYGRESDFYRIRVLGQFPEMDPDVVIDSEWCWAATKTDIYKCAEAGNFQKRFGIDFARMGGDECAVYQVLGYSVINWKAKSRIEPQEILDTAVRYQVQMDWDNNDCLYIIDASGIGQGMIKPARTGGRRVFEFHNGGKASSNAYANKITEAYFHVRDLLKAGVIHMPNDPLLIAQLSSRKYSVNDKTGKIELEPKKVFKKRTHISPDRADAFVEAFYHRTIVKGVVGGIAYSRPVGPKMQKGE